jgi:hypothetical protein
VIKLKDILLENTAPDVFVPRRIEGRLERMIKNYIRNGNKGNLNLSGLNLTVLPEILKDIDVGGSFACINNKLTSLNNSPKSVGESFYCGYNQLISLKGAPTYVGGNFGCSDNYLTSLKGAPESVSGTFGCNGNNLTSLEGAPKFVGGDFFCTDNPVQFTRKGVKSVCNVKGDIFV